MELIGDILKKSIPYHLPSESKAPAPVYQCNFCHDGGFVHPVKDGMVDYSDIVVCRHCITPEGIRKLLGVSSLKSTFANFDVVKGAEDAYKAASMIATMETEWKLLLIYGVWGDGKCLAKGTRVILANGELRKVEDIREGDKLLSPTGDSKEVSGLSRGIGPLYHIRQKGGVDYTVNANHILALKKSPRCLKEQGELMPSGNRRRPRGKFPNYNEEICVSVVDYLGHSQNWRNHFYGYRVSPSFNYKPVAIDAYLLGVWLGDGDSNTSVVTTVDKEIEYFLYDYARKRGRTVSRYGSIRFRIKGGRGHGLTRLLKNYRLLNNKHIPSEYLRNSKNIRLSLLAGLIDTDGCLNSNCYEIVQKSRRLAEDIRYLCFSLGLKCSLTVARKGIKSRGFSGEYYRLNISGDIQTVPVRITRKKPTNMHKNKDTRLTSIKVEYAGEGEYFGFDIGGDGLFLLEDFTVTHNTHLLEAIALALWGKGYQVKIQTFPDFVTRLKGTFDKSSNTGDISFNTLMDRLCSMPYLLLDDVGAAGSFTPFSLQQLEHIMLARYRENLFTVVTSNLDYADLPEFVTSRFSDSEKARIVLNSAPDYRPQKKGEANV